MTISLTQLARASAKLVLPESALNLYRDWRRIDLYNERKKNSFKYLRGKGIEIGGLGSPLPVKRNVKVKYVDYLEENLLKETYSEVKVLALPDYQEDGFILPSFKKNSVDFIIANHVLEHSPNPVAAFIRWYEVVKPGGILYINLPICDQCFDKGRTVTTTDHIFEDYRLYKEDNHTEIRKRNAKHHEEWMDISAVNIHGDNYTIPTGEEREAIINKLLDDNKETHFHTFNLDSLHNHYERLAKEFCPGMKVLKITDHTGELATIVRKGLH